jgi:phosphoribosylformylglycinamidine synthase
MASPLDICVQASNGASDYGNKFGEPVIQGFARSFGLFMPNRTRREWLKPIMFSAGMGQMDHAHAKKGEARPGLLMVKLGGPAYRIGLGGGSASSMVQGENKAELDFNAVQRGDAQMEQKTNRVIRACVELGPHNPIVSIHDQVCVGRARQASFQEGSIEKIVCLNSVYTRVSWLFLRAVVAVAMC